MPVTILWSFGGEQGAAFIAGARYLELHWKAELEKAVHPARVYFAGVAVAPPADAARVQRSAADTGLPWTLIVTAGDGQQEPPEFAARRRNLAAGLAALLILITAGSYFVLRAVNRELAVARLQSDFVSAVSHEFRTPLTTLRQFNELLAEEDGPTPEKRHRFYQAQTRATERLHRFVESLLDFGRMEAGRHPYQFRPTGCCCARPRRDEGISPRGERTRFQRGMWCRSGSASGIGRCGGAFAGALEPPGQRSEIQREQPQR